MINNFQASALVLLNNMHVSQRSSSSECRTSPLLVGVLIKPRSEVGPLTACLDIIYEQAAVQP